MRELLETYDAWRAEGHQVGRAVVIRTYGSAPRQAGSVLLVADDGRMVGSVSGGCVEGAAAEAVAEARRTGHASVIRFGVSDDQAWSVGLACGGTIEVLVQPDVPEAVVEAARAQSTGALPGIGTTVVTDLPAMEPGDAAAGAAADAPNLDQLRSLTLAAGRSTTADLRDKSVFIEAFPIRPRLVIVGATEIARSLVGLAGALGYERVVIDARSAFATRERFPDVEQLLTEWPDDAFEAIDLGPNDAVAVLSHDPKFDEPAIVEAFRRGARYVGAIGSRKTQADRRRRLIEMGLSEAQLAALHGPIGLDLGGRDPAETALAILAEIVASRRGGAAVAGAVAAAGAVPARG
ncbi:MAG: xanthine dehydrogenase accessory factor [Chloroflexota bacterium]|jgi:xanthine dehydrogenase accessory factor|nr:xanthine dehydrogenase accessory factor [Chloroflexota bacterium]